MSSTFGSLNIAKTGLQYQQLAIDTANNNISNVGTDGYVRRRLDGSEISGATGPAMWSTYTGHGQGVTATGVQRLSDLLMTNRVRNEHANLTFLTTQQDSLARVEASIDEPSDNGVASALSAFGSAFQVLTTSTDGTAARTGVIAAGQTLATAINTQATAVASEVSQQQAAVTETVSEINDDATQLAQLNHNIFIAQANGSDVNDLLDQRDKVALDLANKAGATITVQPDGRYVAKINGVDLVPAAGTGAGPDVAYTLAANNLSTAGDPTAGTTLDFRIIKSPAVAADPGDPTAIPPIPATAAVPEVASPNFSITNGEAGAESVLLNSTLKDYTASLNKMASDLATIVNTQHEAGYDQSGTAGQAFFATSDGSSTITAANLRVSTAIVGHPELVAASSVPGAPNNDSGNADAISQALLGKPTADISAANSINISDEYQSMITSLGAKIAGLNTLTANQQSLTDQVDDQNEQTVGVSIDEETINLMEAQRAYQASARVLNTMDSILDTLINHTGA